MSHYANDTQRNGECIERLRVAMKQTPYVSVPIFAVVFGYVGLYFGFISAMVLAVVGVVVALRFALVFQAILEWMALMLIATSKGDCEPAE
ncbi:hypothetical protein [Crateriforma conspicua]|uniref:Uncharacterized protein n=1 Tax=Crateriforma conspicua TaxID=2527996 RepID=A0A5C6FWD1_9PLAN|nr:hypothetical protein [Crateriforma conspicua]TWU65323.1 hypothetical protein V7x_08690 [Crateriforma conspicua]